MHLMVTMTCRAWLPLKSLSDALRRNIKLIERGASSEPDRLFTPLYELQRANKSCIPPPEFTPIPLCTSPFSMNILLVDILKKSAVGFSVNGCHEYCLTSSL
jgi:hypothetical protein